MKKVTTLLSLVLLICILLAGCSKGASSSGAANQQASSTKARDVLRIGGYDEEWEAADLIQSDTFIDIQMTIAEPLFVVNVQTGALEGCLATTPVFNKEGTQMTFEIPAGRTFPNGAALDAGDVKASLEHGIKNGAMSDVFQIITDIKVDGNKLTVSMTSYSTVLMTLLVSPFFCVIDSAQLSSMSNEDLIWGAVPFGPYSITSYTPGKGVTLKRNDGFKTLNPYVKNKGPAYIPTIEVLWYQDQFAMISAFETGELDMLISVTEDAVHALGSRKDVIVSSSLPPMVRNVQMNPNRGVLKDEKIRRAIAYLIDRNNIVEAFGGDLFCTPAYGYITKNVLFHTPQTYDYFKANYANNPEKAMQLLAEAGWSQKNSAGMLVKDGKTMALTFNTAAGKNETAALAIQMQLRKAGLDVNLVTTSEVNSLAAKGEYDLTMCNYWWSDPSRFLVRCFRDHNAFDETEIKKMAKQVETVTDNELRFKLVDQTQRYLMDKIIVLPLYTTSYIKIYRSELAPVVFIVDGLFTNDLK